MEKQPSRADLMRRMDELDARERASIDRIARLQSGAPDAGVEEAVAPEPARYDRIEPDELPIPQRPGRRINILEDRKDVEAREKEKDEATIVSRILGIFENLKRNKASGAPEEIDPAELEKEVAKIPEKEREAIAKGFNNIGFVIERNKHDFFAKILGAAGNGVLDQKGTLARVIAELKNSYTRDADLAHQKARDLAEGKAGWVTKLRNPSVIVGSVFKTGRILADFTTHSFASPLRYVMMVGALSTRLATAGKEGRLQNEEVIEQTRITDADKAAEEAWRIYEDAQVKAGTMGNVSAQELKDAYLMQMPEDIRERLKIPSVGNGFIQWIIKNDLGIGLKGIQGALNELDDDKELSEKEKELGREKIVKKFRASLEDYDRMVSQYGTVDGWAMAGRYAQTAGKAVVAAVQVETMVLSLEKLYGSVADILTSHNIHPIDALSRMLHHGAEKPAAAVPPVVGHAVLPPQHVPEVSHPTPNVPPETHPAGTPTQEDQFKYDSGGRRDPFTPLHPDTHVPGTAPTVEHSVETPVPSPAAKIPENINLDQDAIVGHHEGIENAFIRQIEHNPALAEKLGYRQGMDLHQFAGSAAHRVALDHGYVDKATGQQIFVRPENEVGYKIRLENGEIKVDEIKVHGGLVETRNAGDAFETGDKVQNYEYGSTEHPVTAPTDIVSKNISDNSYDKFNLKEPEVFHKPGWTPIENAHDTPPNQPGKGYFTREDGTVVSQAQMDKEIAALRNVHEGYASGARVEAPIQRPAGQNIFFGPTRGPVIDNRFGGSAGQNIGFRTGGGSVRGGYGSNYDFYNNSSHAAIEANKYGGYSGPAYFALPNGVHLPHYTDLSPQDNMLLETHKEFLEGNPVNMSGPAVMKAFYEYTHNLNVLTTKVPSGNEIWHTIRDTRADKVLEQTNNDSPFINFIHRLQGTADKIGGKDVSNPRGNFLKGHENVEHYIARLTKFISAAGKAGEVRLE